MGRKIRTEAEWRDRENASENISCAATGKLSRRNWERPTNRLSRWKSFNRRSRRQILPRNLSTRGPTRARNGLSRLPTAAAEYGVIRTYLDWLVSLPWSRRPGDVAMSRSQGAGRNHYGLKGSQRTHRRVSCSSQARCQAQFYVY